MDDALSLARQMDSEWDKDEWNDPLILARGLISCHAQLDAALKINAEWAERYRTAPSTERERYWQDQYTEMNIEVKRLRMLLEAADIYPDENH